MKFKSTRGKIGSIGFIDAFMMGLGNDGGLLVPEEIPQVSPATLKSWQDLSYQELVLEIFSLYTNGEIDPQTLQSLIQDSYSTFRTPEVAPVRQLDDNLYLLELFHGPTFAFKDVALQFMGQLYTYVATQQDRPIHILGATSGDTGASAIEGVKGKPGIKVCILHPHGKVSKVQELQMTTVQEDNVLNLSVDGNFDDCQRIIKVLFADLDFKSQHHLAAINSINFVRIMAQTVYYFYAYFQVAKKTGRNEPLHFSVPTGNFGDIFAGYLAKRMGLPVGKLILATNENNILERFVLEGIYKPGNFQMTYSPSMDIQVASNFERYLYYVLGEDAEQTSRFMAQFSQEGAIAISEDTLAQVQDDFGAYGVSNQECLDTIKQYYAQTGYLLDPHSACGVAAAAHFEDGSAATISLATAHPAKFNEAIERTGIEQPFPAPIAALFERPQIQTRVDSSLEAIRRELVTFYTKG